MKCPVCRQGSAVGASTCIVCGHVFTGGDTCPGYRRDAGDASRERIPVPLDDGLDAYICPATGLPFVEIPAGRFEMGDLWGDGYSEERPTHLVEVQAFQLSRTLVTQGMWERIMGRNPAEKAGDEKFLGKDKPVVYMSWEEAQAFIGRLNRLVPEGRYRLPSEAEWEYAARAGGQWHKWPGTNRECELVEYAWYGSNIDWELHPVAEKKPNGLGLYDLAGNVWEWCQDRWHDDYAGAPTDGSAWEAGDNEARVMRGGSCTNAAIMLRTTCRCMSNPFNRLYPRGVRLARNLSRTTAGSGA